MTEITLDLDELEKRWDKLYFNLIVLNSKNLAAIVIIKSFKDKLVLFHEDITKFFEAFKQ